MPRAVRERRSWRLGAGRPREAPVQQREARGRPRRRGAHMYRPRPGVGHRCRVGRRPDRRQVRRFRTPSVAAFGVSAAPPSGRRSRRTRRRCRSRALALLEPEAVLPSATLPWTTPTFAPPAVLTDALDELFPVDTRRAAGARACCPPLPPAPADCARAGPPITSCREGRRRAERQESKSHEVPPWILVVPLLTRSDYPGLATRKRSSKRSVRPAALRPVTPAARAPRGPGSPCRGGRRPTRSSRRPRAGRRPW